MRDQRATQGLGPDGGTPNERSCQSLTGPLASGALGSQGSAKLHALKKRPEGKVPLEEDRRIRKTMIEDGAAVQRWVEELQKGINVEGNSRRLFSFYYGWVRRFFQRRSVRPEEAEELTQEVFLQVFQKVRSYRGEGTFRSWLFAAATNVLRNDRRRRSQQKRDGRPVSLETGEPDEGTRDLKDPAVSPLETFYRRERLDALAAAIRELPEKQRDCIRLRLAGRDYAEIAVLLKLAPSTVRVHVHAARQRLVASLGEEYGPWLD